MSFVHASSSVARCGLGTRALEVKLHRISASCCAVFACAVSCSRAPGGAVVLSMVLCCTSRPASRRWRAHGCRMGMTDGGRVGQGAARATPSCPPRHPSSRLRCEKCIKTQDSRLLNDRKKQRSLCRDEGVPKKTRQPWPHLLCPPTAIMKRISSTMCHELNLDGLQAAVAEAASAGECRFAGKAKWIVHDIGSHHNIGGSKQAASKQQASSRQAAGSNQATQRHVGNFLSSSPSTSFSSSASSAS